LKIVTLLVFLCLPFLGFGQYGKRAIRGYSTKHLIAKPVEFVGGIRPIKFSQFSSSVIHRIRTEFEKSIELLQDTLNLPDSIFHLAYNGDFALSGFGLSIANLESVFGKSDDSERNIKTVVNLLNLEAKKANTFSQLNILKSLELGGKNLTENKYWQRLNPDQRREWKAAANVRIMYDPATKTILNGRPTNYLGVAAQIATLSYALGFEEDKQMVNDLLDLCLSQLIKNEGYLNDGKDGEFRFDRYHFEYIRFLWESAKRLNRNDILIRLEPWCEKSDQLWINLMHPVSGSSFAYGRSLQNTWEDVGEYGAFMLKRKHRSKMERREILSQIHHTWNYYSNYEYDQSRHIARMLDTGRACYSYVGSGRIWGYSVHALGKMLGTIHEINDAGFAGVDFRKYRYLISINRFFKLKENYGLWIIRNKNTRITIPFVTGIGKPTNSDYQPIPFAEGISEPPVGIATTHLIPGIYKNGKMYLPKLSLTKFPEELQGNYLYADSVQLSAFKWISKSDTLPADSAPVLKVVYVNKNHVFSMVYRLQNLESVHADSLVYSIWKSKWKGSPYEVKGVEAPKWEIDANVFEQKEYIHDLMKPEGRGAFTALPNRTELVLKNPAQTLKWEIRLKLP